MGFKAKQKQIATESLDHKPRNEASGLSFMDFSRPYPLNELIIISSCGVHSDRLPVKGFCCVELLFSQSM